MSTNTLGEILAILTAFTTAVSIILFRLSGQHVSPRTLNIFKSVVGVIIFTITIPMFTNFIPDFLTTKDLMIIIITSIVGKAIGETLFFESINKLGSSVVGTVQALFVPTVVFLATAFFGEKLTINVYIGAGLVVSGIFILTINKEFLFTIGHTERKNFLLGLLYGFLAIFSWAITTLIVTRPSFIIGYSLVQKYNPLWFSWVAAIAAIIALLPFSLISRTGKSKKDLIKAFTPSKIWKILIPAGIAQGYIMIVLWISALRLVDKISVASILNQLSIVFLIFFSWIMLKEKITIRKIIASAFALSGVIVTLI